jgi:hypothetical protein
VTQILAVKPGTLTRADKTKLRANNVVCVEAERPEDVRLIGTEGPPLDGNDLFFAAMRAMAETSDDALTRYAKSRFVAVLAKLMADKRADAKAATE